MGFDAYGASQHESKPKVEIDWKALNEYTVETAGLENPEVLVGVVSGIVDLGIQEQEDAEMEFTGTEEEEAVEIEKNPNTYFKDGKNDKGKDVRLKCWPQRAQQSVAIAVDFPDIMIDKGQFFGSEPDPRPLRLWLGNQFYDSYNKMMVVGRPTALKVTKNADNKWSFNAKHLFYKMALAAKLIKNGEVFLPEHIDKLLGQAFQFEAQVFFKMSKGVPYYTEYIKFQGGLGRGQEAPTLPNPTFLVQFNKANDPKLLKEVRSHVLNTISKAKNYEGSPIQKQIEAQSKSRSDNQDDDADTPTEASVKVEAPAVKRKPKPAPVDDIDDSIPF
jgi:hypothetical protein